MRHELIEIKINTLSHDGRGIANIEGKTAFISGALPNEQVLCKVTKKHKRYYEGHTLEVISSSPERITPGCAHFSICGGCSMQHLSSDAQIQFKQQVLLEQLKHFGNVVPETILPPITGNPWGYRRKARLGVRYVRKKGKLLVGFREKYSNFLADIEECPVLHPTIGTKITALSQLIQGLTQYEQIPQIEVAVSDTQAALIFRHLTPLTESDIEQLSQFGMAHDIAIYLQPNPPAATHKIWPKDQENLLTYSLPDYDLNMHFHPLDFTQINGEINRLMVKQALTLLDPQSNETILDLFCGLGNFTLPIARFAKKAVGIEGSQNMVLRARDNATANHITNADFFSANLAEPSPQAEWLQNTYDKILLDPPRTGAKEIIPLFTKWPANRVVYISCNPATLARDAGDLVYNYNYRLKQIGVINMFPHTSHIEAIALFEK